MVASVTDNITYLYESRDDGSDSITDHIDAVLVIFLYKRTRSNKLEQCYYIIQDIFLQHKELRNAQRLHNAFSSENNREDSLRQGTVKPVLRDYSKD